MSRCVFCKKRVWPWQRQGHYVSFTRKIFYWHGKCYRDPRADGHDLGA